MKLLIAATILLAGTALGHASNKKQQDWAACLIGQSALALLDVADGKNTGDASDAAQEIAYTKCRKPAGMGDQELESLGDFVNATVLSIADRRVFCSEK